MPREGQDGGRDAIVTASSLLRLGMDGAANDEMVKVIDEMGALLSDPGLPGIQEISEVLVQILSAQERGDVLRVADLLEFELLPRIPGAQERTQRSALQP